MVKHIKTVEEFNSLYNKGKVLVDFFATWCGPCKMLAPVIDEIDSGGEVADTLILKVDVDLLSPLAAQFGVQSIPTLILFKDGEIVKHSLGYMNQNQLLKFLK
ncbi:MAG: thioredoxin [Bacilli bacterium]|jgi:thioredoxin 1